MGNQALDNFRKKQIELRKSGKHTPLVLMILDGWGIAPNWGGNAIGLAKTQNFDTLWKSFPKTELHASGEAVGLPAHAPGNSEAGHLNIGAGRVIRQDIVMVDEELKTGKLNSSESLRDAIKQVKDHKSNVHIMGLLSDAGTHSHIKHIVPILRHLLENKIKNVYIHLFSDGRDSDPISGIEFIDQVEKMTREVGIGTIATVIGRYYAMDRDNHWDRTLLAYNLLTKCEGERVDSTKSVFSQSYSNGVTDEFIKPTIIVNKHQACSPISDNDIIISFNFRPDRIKQLIYAFLKEDISKMSKRKFVKNIKILSFTIYHANEDLAEHIFTPNKIKHSLAEITANNNFRQLHCAETEKFPHVTYFINGGIETAFNNEDRIMIPSPKVKTYDLKPEMSAEKVTKTIILSLGKKIYDLIIVNYANPDMVGHTGDLDATIVAIEFLDQCLGKVYKKISEIGGTLLISADHGNAEQMVNIHTGGPDTEHTTNKVPFIVVNKELRDQISLKTDGALCNITPTIYDLLGVDPPDEIKIDQSLII